MSNEQNGCDQARLAELLNSAPAKEQQLAVATLTGYLAGISQRPVQQNA